MVLHRHAAGVDLLRGFVHALVLADMLTQGKSESVARGDALSWIRDHFPAFQVPPPALKYTPSGPEPTPFWPRIHPLWP